MDKTKNRRRSRILAPDYHVGRKAPNEGRELPAEELTEDDVNRLFAAFPRRAEGVRNKAIATLAYRADLKWADLASLYRRHYNPENGTLVVAGRGRQPERRVQLDHTTRDVLDQWLATRRRLNIGPVAPLFCATMEFARGNALWPSSIRTYLSQRGAALGIENRVTIEGLRLSGRRHREGGATRRLIDELTLYLNESAFAARHPIAHEKWRQAFELYGLNPSRYASQIGLACREACTAFANDLAEIHGADVALEAGTVDKLRAAIRARHAVGKRLPAALDALVRYWGSVNDLVQRQVHGAAKEGENLTKEDARRLLFQSMFVMGEIDRALEVR